MPNKIKRFLLRVIFLLPLYMVYRYLKLERSIVKELEIDLKDIKENSGIILDDDAIIVRKINGEVDILSLKCTHLGCTLRFSNGRFSCPCHGSEFDIKGNPIKGPAKKPLKLYDFIIRNNKIYVKIV